MVKTGKGQEMGKQHTVYQGKIQKEQNPEIKHSQSTKIA